MQTAPKQKIPRRKLGKSFFLLLLKSNFSSFFAHSFSRSDQSRLVRVQNSGLWRAPRAGRSRGRPPRPAPLTAAIRTRGPAGARLPPLRPTPGSRSSGSRRPRRSFVTRFPSFRERAGGRARWEPGEGGTASCRAALEHRSDREARRPAGAPLNAPPTPGDLR